jgi:aryl carrier-like protein
VTAYDKGVGCRQVRELVGGEVAPDEPLAAQGLDSLAGMELRQKLQV